MNAISLIIVAIIVAAHAVKKWSELTAVTLMENSAIFRTSCLLKNFESKCIFKLSHFHSYFCSEHCVRDYCWSVLQTVGDFDKAD